MTYVNRLRHIQDFNLFIYTTEQQETCGNKWIQISEVHQTQDKTMVDPSLPRIIFASKKPKYT